MFIDKAAFFNLFVYSWPFLLGLFIYYFCRNETKYEPKAIQGCVWFLFFLFIIFSFHYGHALLRFSIFISGNFSQHKVMGTRMIPVPFYFLFLWSSGPEALGGGNKGDGDQFLPDILQQLQTATGFKINFDILVL